MKEEQPLLINTFSTSDNAGKSTTGLNGQFVYSQLLIDCLLRMKSNEIDKNELISLCEKEYEGNNSQLNVLREFKHDYSPRKVLWWYTRDTFFYRVLNKALRVQNIEMLFLFRSYIYDMHSQLQYFQLKSSVRVYRSQLMTNEEINSLKQYIGQFISINSFLSTTIQRETAVFFLGDGDDHPTDDDLNRVLFEIDADSRMVTTKPFADITSQSDFPIETEVLFMLGSIFRLNNITFEDNRLWIIQMTLCSDDEHDLRQVLMHMKNQNSNGETDLRILAKIVWKMGKFDLAEKYYHRLIKEIPPNDHSLIALYEDLGEITAHKGDYDMSIQWHNKALEIRLQNPAINDTNISAAVSSIGRFLIESSKKYVFVYKIQ
jgi:tetratricopeptide (TPR) repeat protein